MGDYNFNRGRGRLGTRFQTWDTVEDDWNNNTKPVRDHVCRPVIVDSEGRASPGIFFLPPPTHETDGYQTKIETTVVEHVYPPLPYKVSPPTTETLKEYSDYDTNIGLRKSYNGDQPSKINEFIAGVQTSGPTGGRQMGFSGGIFQRRTANYGNDRGGAPTQDSGARPNGAIASHRPNNYHEDNYNGRNASEQKFEGSRVPRVWMRSGRPGGASPPKYESSITKPTNDIGALAESVKDSARAPAATNAPVRGRFYVEPPAEFQKMQTIEEVIDSKEAAKRYGNLANSKTKIDPSLPTIDSKKAAVKYGGTTV